MPKPETYRLAVTGQVDASGPAVVVTLKGQHPAIVGHVPLPQGASQIDIERAVEGMERLLQHLPPGRQIPAAALIV